MIFPKEFFELNFQFAQRIVEVTGLDLATSLLLYTHLYMRFGLGRSFDPENPLWQAYIAGLGETDDPGTWTYQMYLQQAQTDSPVASPFGCFSYAIWSDNRIRIHFHNADKAPQRPLSKERMSVRLAELEQMFAEICHKVPEATNVVGGSWLYSMEGYRRLFPPAFLNTAYVGEDDVQFMAQWGQFLRWDGEVKRDVANAFLDNLQRQSSLAGLLSSFPFPVLRVECAVESFYDFYQIQRS